MVRLLDKPVTLSIFCRWPFFVFKVFEAYWKITKHLRFFRQRFWTISSVNASFAKETVFRSFDTHFLKNALVVDGLCLTAWFKFQLSTGFVDAITVNLKFVIAIAFELSEEFQRAISDRLALVQAFARILGLLFAHHEFIVYVQTVFS